MVGQSYKITDATTQAWLNWRKKSTKDFQQNGDNSHVEEKCVDSNSQKKFSYRELFRYSTLGERLLVSISIFMASLASLAIPYSIIIYGEFTSLLVDRISGIGSSTRTFLLEVFGGGKILINATKEENMEAIREDALAFGLGSLAGAVIELALLALSIYIMNYIALKQISRIRKLFLESILRQEMAWYDTTSNNSFASKMTEDLDKMKEGMGEKIAIFTFLIMTFISSVIISFFYGWKLTLVVFICCPFIILSTALVAKVQSSLTEKELKAYAGAGSLAEEVFSGIRTVMAFCGERTETERYAKLLVPAEQTGKKKGLYSGIGGGAMWFIIYCCYCIAMWYGVRLILEDRYSDVRQYTPAVMVIVLFGIIMGAQNLGFASPHLESFTTAKAASQSIFSIIDRKSDIDPLDANGQKPENIVGDITFENIHFNYPARPNIPILRGLNVKVKAGQTVAFVGPSGCGKSTTLQLMQRFYNPLKGFIKLDNYDLRDLNVTWLRSQIGVVGQEPALFATTISENIRYGHPKATQKEIENAARMANCHDFISKLTEGYNTMVGERGAQLSGGQKQRIAIARALVRNPKILLLDEATSALDTTSESRVQEALEIASKGRTTLVVSHRLSTVTNADKIVFIKDGVVAEQGTHAELMARRGLYFHLVEINKGNENRSPKSALRSKKEIDPDTSSEEEESSDEDKVSVKSEDGSIASKKKKRTKRKQKKPKSEKYKITFKQLMKMNAPEWRLILAGCVAAMIHGATFPIWSVLFGDFFGILGSDDDDYIRAQTNLLAIMFIVVGVMAGLGTLLATYMFNLSGVRMTSRLRQTAFKTIIYQEAAYFDDEKNSVGALCSRLAGDCSNVQGATGSRVGIMVQAFSTLFIGIIIAFVYSWNLTLVTLVTVPFVCLSIFLEARFMESSAAAEKEAIEDASRIAVEGIANIRTVASLGLERNLMDRYCQNINAAEKASRKKVRLRGGVYGLGQAAPFLAYGVSLYYGGLLVANEGLSYENVIKVSEALIFGSWMLGQALGYAPNVSAAILSAGRLLKLFEKAPATIYNPQEKPFNTADKLDGDITYEHIDFHYPSRKQLPILQDLNLTIKRDATIALVGPSGSGKSTCIQLLLRYYDPVKGSVNLSGIPTTDFSYATIRSKMGLVSQEPVLFDRTIAENIAYGDNSRDDIPINEIIEAARKSNIHDFVTLLPQGYETRLGSKGTQLSGGQKQRIAIARALIRNPKILILDEATSALDMESEKVVQEALDAARHGRTCITIAHRLTTVRDADLIYVLKHGAVVESGRHDELMELNGIYAGLYKLQQVA